MQNGASPSQKRRGAIETATTEQSIFRILERLRETRALLTVSLPGHDSHFTSAILEVNCDRHRLFLDELMPSEGQGLMSVTTRLNVCGRLHGLLTRFSSSVAHIEQRAGIAYNGLLFPDLIEYEQKRSAYRVHIGLAHLVPVKLDGFRGGPVTGQLRNLSVTGLGAVFPANAQISAGTVVPSCQLQLATGKPFTCALDIRFARPDRANRELYIGGHFINVSPVQERAIQRAVCTFERKLLRK